MSEPRKKPSKLIQSRWYFLGYVRDIDLSLDNPYLFSIYGQKFALWGSCDRQWICYSLPQTADFCFKSFTVVEKQGSIWVWYGKQELADENSIPVMDS